MPFTGLDAKRRYQRSSLIGDAGLEASYPIEVALGYRSMTPATLTIAYVSVANSFWRSEPCTGETLVWFIGTSIATTMYWHRNFVEIFKKILNQLNLDLHHLAQVSR